MKKLLLSIIIITLAIISAACAENTSEGKESTTVKLGISGTDTRIWDFVAKKAEKEGIDIEIVSFSDYVAPNTALAEGEIDVNAFQTVAYFDVFIKEHNLDLVPIATTVLAPMGIYSEKYKDVKDIPDGAKLHFQTMHPIKAVHYYFFKKLDLLNYQKISIQMVT